MATFTIEGQYPKSIYSPEQVETARQAKLARGAVSSTLSENDEFYILTTVWNQIEGPL